MLVSTATSLNMPTNIGKNFVASEIAILFNSMLMACGVTAVWRAVASGLMVVLFLECAAETNRFCIFAVQQIDKKMDR